MRACARAGKERGAEKDGENERERVEATARLMHNLSQLKQEDVSQLEVIAVKMVIARRNFIPRVYFRGRAAPRPALWKLHPPRV